MSAIRESSVLEALKVVTDPDLGRDIVSLGFIKNLAIDDGRVSFTIELTTPACPVKDQMRDQAQAAVSQVGGVTSVDVEMTASVRSAEAGVALGATSRVHAEEPPQPLDRLPAPRVEDTPLFLADLVHGLIQRLDEMEAVDDERHLGAVVRDRPDIGGAHVATGPGDTRFLSPAQPVVEEAIDGVTALA